jgi:hypothetical protein
MTTDELEEVARRFANARPGYQLVDYHAVALPLFQVEVEMVVLDRKNLPPIQEFVLRTVAAGFSETEEIAGFLGIEETVVRTATAELLAGDDLVLGGGIINRRHRLKLTAKGQKTVTDVEQVQAVDVTHAIWIDGLTRQVLPQPRERNRWFAAAGIRARGLTEVRPSPNHAPKLEAIPLKAVREVVHAEWARRADKREVIGLAGVGRAHRFARQAVALAYRAPGDDEPLVTLVIDGEPSEAHDTAFAESQAHSARRLTPVRWEDARAVAEEVLPSDLLAQAAAPEVTARVGLGREEVRNTEEELRIATGKAQEEEKEEEIERLRERLRQAEERQRVLEDELDAYSVRSVPVYEHRTYLKQALTEARERLVLVSPWIRYEVVDDNFVDELRRVLERGVELWIGYGMSKDAKTPDRKKVNFDQDLVALGKLKALVDEFPDLFRLTRFGDTHAKVLICDRRFAIVTSFNWLSFRGDGDLAFRDERGFYVAVPRAIDQLMDSYGPRFDEAEDDVLDDDVA